MILNRIVADNRLELESRKRAVPLAELKRLASAEPAPIDFTSALRGDRIRLIAEIKKASPSRGVIRQDFHPAQIAGVYAAGGASAISVLTESKYFQGGLEHLRDVKNTLAGKKIPLLRKDFITDEYQIYESRAYGADSLLLIVALLALPELKKLLALSHSLNMDCLVEVHDEAELQIALESGAGIIGINNRDLKTFKVDITTTERLRPLIPAKKIVVSESGIKGRDDILRLENLGVNAVLIGEAFMSTPDIAVKMRELW